MAPLANDPDSDWERFGNADPYFSVITAPQYHGNLSESARAEFFRSGESHIDQVFSIVRDRLHPPFAPVRALDFGCGVGRLLIPLAARCRDVTGVDVSASMLAEAGRNADAAGATNIRLLPSDDNLSTIDGQFDFVHSYIVLQHIPVRRGERLVQELAKRLAPNGVGVFHVTYSRAQRPILNRALYWARTRVPFAHPLLNLAFGRSARAPLMQGNKYSVTRILDILWRQGCGEVHVRFSDHDGNRGVVLFARKAEVPVFGEAGS